MVEFGPLAKLVEQKRLRGDDDAQLGGHALDALAGDPARVDFAAVVRLQENIELRRAVAAVASTGDAEERARLFARQEERAALLGDVQLKLLDRSVTDDQRRQDGDCGELARQALRFRG